MRAIGGPPVPIAATVMDQVEAVRLLPGPGEDDPAVPAYAYPESAARALGHAVRYGMWRALPPGRVPDLDGLRQDRARELVTGLLTDAPKGGWLPLDATAELLGCYGVPLVDRIAVTTQDAAVAAAARFAAPVALKADVPGLVRKSAAGAVLIGLHGANDVRRGFRSLRETFGDRLAAVIVQPIIIGGVEVMISVLQEQMFGPLVLFGLGGAAAYVLADRAARLAPLTDSDAGELIRAAPPRSCWGAPAPPPPTSPRCGTCCCGSPSWPTTCRKSPNSTCLSSPALTGPGPSTARSASRRPSPPTPTCAGCDDR